MQNRGFRERERVKGLFHIYDNIISFDNLLISWQEFLRGKTKRKDVTKFQLHFMDNILLLHQELRDKSYQHGKYTAFKINDPKPRDIHKALVRDRLVHHALHRFLYPYFDRLFIYDSYSCRMNKGAHKAISRFCYFGCRVSQNNTKTVWVLKCDIQKFFANIDHEILKDILYKNIDDKDVLWLIAQVIDSFTSIDKIDIGLPLGNLTSQLLINIYMNEFDQYVKHKLKVRYYIRYADDFVFLSEDKNYFKKLLFKIDLFFKDKLKLILHPNKISITSLASGIDFLGYVIFPDHIILRTKTKKRIFRKIRKNKIKMDQGLISKESFNQSIQSYYGILKHCNGYKLKQKIDEFI